MTATESTRSTRSLVFAIDLPFASEGLGPIRELAAVTGWKIHVLHAVAPEPSFVGFDLSVDGYDENKRRRVFDDAADQVDSVAAGLRRDGFDAEGHTRLGAPVDVIIANAKQWLSTMIVVTGRKHHLARRMVAGSVASALVRTSPIPVLVLPAADIALRDAIQSFEAEHPTVIEAVNEITYQLGGIGI